MSSAARVTGSAVRRWRLLAIPLGLAILLGWSAAAVLAQDQAQGQAAAAPAGPPLLSAEELRVVVAPIALYPDDVLALVLPASTTGLQIVAAQRFLDKHKTDPSAKPDDKWDPSVAALINYPDVVARLNADLDWTQRLGDAVLNQQKDVMDAIQQIRAEAAAAGYLKSNDKQTVEQDKQTVVIKSADPQVVYVPDYDPQVVVQQTYASYPPPAYYNPYPPYYSPAATFFTGAVVGAAFAYAFDWHDDDIDIHFDDDWHRGGNVNFNNINNNINNVDLNRFDANRVRTGQGNSVTWGGNKQRERRQAESAGTRERRTAGVAPVALGDGASDRARQAAGVGGTGNRIGDRAGRQDRTNGLGNPQRGRDVANQSARGSKSLQGTGIGSARQKSLGGGTGVTSRQGPSSAGAFGGFGSGKSVGAQRSRGAGSLGGRPMRRR